MKKLAEVLKTNVTLTELDIRQVQAGRRGAAALAACLAENRALRFVDARWNGVPAEALDAFADFNAPLEGLRLAERWADPCSAGAAAAAYESFKRVDIFQRIEAKLALNVKKAEAQPVRRRYRHKYFRRITLIYDKAQVKWFRKFREKAPLMRLGRSLFRDAVYQYFQ